MKAPKKQSFTVQMKVVAVVDVEIKADNFSAALEQAKALDMKDMLTTTDGTSYNDDRLCVVGIFGGEEWDT